MESLRSAFVDGVVYRSNTLDRLNYVLDDMQQDEDGKIHPGTLKRNFGYFSHLTSVDLSFSAITKLPKSFRGLSNLQELILRGCTNIADISEGLHSSTNSMLKYVDLSFSAITKLPKSFQHALMGCTNIVDLSEGLHSSTNPKLEHVDLSLRGVTKLPESFYQFEDMQDRFLRSFPSNSRRSPAQVSEASSFASTAGVTPIFGTGENEEWLILFASLTIEGLSALFEQLDHDLLGMLLAISGLFVCVAEFCYRARTEQVSLEWIGNLPFLFSHYPSYRPFGTTVHYFGLVAAIWQCFHASFGFFYASQNPIKMSLTMFLFCLCLIVSKIVNKYSTGSHHRLGEA